MILRYYFLNLKPKKEDTYEIIGYTEEVSISGVPKRSLGAFICDSGDGNTFNVGTGFTALQRHDFWNTREDLVGKNVRIQYQHLTSGKKFQGFLYLWR